MLFIKSLIEGKSANVASLTESTDENRRQNTRTTQKRKNQNIFLKVPKLNGNTDNGDGEEVVVTKGEGQGQGGGHRVEYHKKSMSSEVDKVRFFADLLLLTMM